MRPYHHRGRRSSFHVVINILSLLLLLLSVCLTNVNTAKFHDNLRNINHNTNTNNNNGDHHKLQFITEPESVLDSADGRRISFKCSVLPREAQIKWLLNGTIIQENTYDWIKINENKLTIKFQRLVDDHLFNPDHDSIIREQRSHQLSLPPPVTHHYHSSNQINLQGAVFQCLAELNDQVIVSQPAKLIIAELSPFDERQEDRNITAIAGNTIVIPCELPHSIPFAVAEFEFNNITITSKNISQERYRILPSGNLLITSVKPNDSGAYKCIAHNPFLQEKVFANHFVYLKVIKKHAPPDLKKLKFILQPKQQITSILGSNITLECMGHGHPVPKISWTKINGELPPTRSFIDNGILVITTVQKEDEGVYSCTAFNSKVKLESTTELRIYEMPQIINEEYEVIEMEKGKNYELYCNAKGTPKPLISWLHNGYVIDSQMTNYVFFEQDGAVLKIYSANPQNHSGIFQCFATNELGTTYSIKVIHFKSFSVNPHPINHHHDQFMDNSMQNGHNQFNVDFDPSESTENFNTFNNFNIHEDAKLDRDQNNNRKKNKNKDLRLIPPSKPEVSMLNDDSVMVRWHVPKSTGLPIMFFKVQYKEHGHGDWNTVDVDIPPYIFSYAVCCLNPNSTYRFRIAAVYSNDDNKNGKSSNKFVFHKDPFLKRPINAPTIINATSLSPTEIRVKWELLNIDMQPVDGFFINYRAADSVGQYLMVTAIGSNTRQQNISFLQPNTVYEIKMQCFNEAGTSEFSNIYTIKTLALEPVEKEPDLVPKLPPIENDISKPLIDQEKMQIIAILVVSTTTLLVIMACVIIFCVRQSKSTHSPKIKKEKVIKPPSDYYFTSINYDRRLASNGQLNSVISGDTNNVLAPPHVTSNRLDHEETDSTPNGHVNPINGNVPSLNRRNSYRNSLSYSSNHLYSSSNNIKSSNNEMMNHSNENGCNTATIDRKRPLKNSIPGAYLDQYSSPSNNHNHSKMNHHSVSFTRLNGTLERKRRSRQDLNGFLEKPSLNVKSNNNNNHHHLSSTTDLDRGSSYFHHHPTSNGGHFVIMQSSC